MKKKLTEVSETIVCPIGIYSILQLPHIKIDCLLK